jgi:GntR family transcriptional regulator, transcriptional repressor for pyruvate dehydrogenase complex
LDTVIEPIERGSLVEEVLRRLEALLQDLPAGAQLPTEQQLCQQLGVSRTSLRAAMQRLAERGLVSVEVGRGTFVRQPDTQRLAEQLGLLVQLDRGSYWQITEARRMIETQTAALAAARRTDSQLQAMREALTAMDASMTDIEGFAAGDERFHLAIAAAADNEILAMFSQQLQAMIRGTRREVFSVIEISPRAQEYHWSIYRAIERRAPAEAMAAVNGHLEEMEDYVRRTLGNPRQG